MLQKIVFQDNIYQLSRSIDLVYEGLLLDLSSDFFFDKMVDDLLFFDASIQKLFKLLELNSQIAGYMALLHSMYSCQNRYLKLIDSIISGKASMTSAFSPLLAKLQCIRNAHLELQATIAAIIQKGDISGDSRDIVSSNELSELLNF